jgi:hypothetical protein
VEGPNARFLDINNMNSSGNTSSISHNNILFDLSGSYGNSPLFKISDCSYLSVINNVIHNNTGVIVSGQSTAFEVRGTDKSLFKENKVYWPGRGFELWGSDDGEVNGYCCNIAKEVPTSSSNFNFRFYSNHGESFFRQNKLNRLNLFTGADIGPQKNAGNLWEGPGSLASISNGTLQDAQDNPFFTNFNIQGAKPLNIHPIIFEEDWFININQSIPTCQNNPDCGIPPFSFQDDDEDLTDDGPDAQDPPIIIVDPARPTCDALKDLYKRLEGIDSTTSPISYWSVISLINKWKIWKGASWIEACLDSVVTFNPDITPWYDAEKEKDGVYKTTESQRQLMAPYMSEMLALTDDISQIQIDSTMTLTPAQVQLYQDLYTAHNLYNSGVNVFKQSMVDRANNLLPDLIALPTPLPFLADKKKVWIAEMKIVIGGISALDSTEWNEIREIALKCPNEFGQAVFEAQTLMRSIGEEYSSDPECLPSTPRSKNDRVIAQDILVSPNPGSGHFDFSWFKDVQIDAISIFDITGRLIIKKDIRSDQNQISIDITNQVHGVYIWEAKAGIQVKQKGKIIKI